jgi:uncharacterized membrane protein HdeD (DUF308 family)
MELAGANYLPKEVADKVVPHSKGLIMVAGFLDLFIGIIFILMPLVGGVVIAWLAGLLLIVLGMIYLYMAFTGRKVDVPKVEMPKV